MEDGSLVKALTLPELLIEEAALVALIVKNEGEILPELEKILQESQGDLKKKLDSYYHVIQKLEAEAEIHRREANAERKIASRCVETADRMRSCLKEAMLHHGKTDFIGNRIRWALTHLEDSFEIADDVKWEDIPPSFLKAKITYTLDEEAVKADLLNSARYVKRKANYRLTPYRNTERQTKKEIKTHERITLDRNHAAEG